MPDRFNSVAPSNFIWPLFAALIPVDTGMRSRLDIFREVRRLVPARQHCAPVSARALIDVSVPCDRLDAAVVRSILRVLACRYKYG